MNLYVISSQRTVNTALKTGYRLFDLADCYRNSAEICEILSEILPTMGLERKDVFLTSKIAPKDQGKIKSEAACLKILQDCRVLGEERLDLVLIHWPGTSKVKHHESVNRENRL